MTTRGIEAGTGETREAGLDPKDESPVTQSGTRPNTDTPTTISVPEQRDREAACTSPRELLEQRATAADLELADDLHDMFPGSGAVTEAWRTWRGLFTLPESGPLFERDAP